MISTHILDTSKGMPAAGISVRLLKQDSSTQWNDLAQGVTNSDGRHVFQIEKKPGVFQLIFEIEPYLKNEKSGFFFLSAPVIFKIEDTGRNYHVPLLLNPYGYSTYRGS